MKRTYNHQFVLVEDDSQQFYGISLGWDHAAEHEWGIKALQRDFGVPADVEKMQGLPNYTITQVPDEDHLALIDDLFLYTPYDLERASEHALDLLTLNYEVSEDFPGFTAAWDERSFAVLSAREEITGYLKELWNAFQEKDVAFWLGGRGDNPFANNSLVFAIASRVPQELQDHMRKYDEESKELRILDRETGIRQKLTDAGKSFYSLAPRRYFFIQRDRPSEHDVVYWLNPADQKNNSAGWYTVEELELWIEGKGPVPKS